jgi:hypothetical protein
MEFGLFVVLVETCGVVQDFLYALPLPLPLVIPVRFPFPLIIQSQALYDIQIDSHSVTHLKPLIQRKSLARE